MLSIITFQLFVEAAIPLIDVVHLLFIDEGTAAGELPTLSDLLFDLISHALPPLLV